MFDMSRTIRLPEAGFDECFEDLRFFIGPMGAGALRAPAPIGPVILEQIIETSEQIIETFAKSGFLRKIVRNRPWQGSRPKI